MDVLRLNILFTTSLDEIDETDSHLDPAVHCKFVHVRLGSHFRRKADAGSHAVVLSLLMLFSLSFKSADTDSNVLSSLMLLSPIVGARHHIPIPHNDVLTQVHLHFTEEKGRKTMNDFDTIFQKLKNRTCWKYLGDFLMAILNIFTFMLT